MLQKLRGSNEKGFTLIELMIVIAIIGILAAIAIPNFVSYRQRSYNSSSQSDMKNAMTTQEAYFVDYATYTANTTNLGNAGFVSSSKVTLSVANATATGYQLTAYHSSGNVTWSVQGPGGVITKAS